MIFSQQANARDEDKEDKDDKEDKEDEEEEEDDDKGDMPWPYTWRVETIIGRRFRTTTPFQNEGMQVCGNINIWECGNTHMKSFWNVHICL